MKSIYSKRFARAVVLTKHARERMSERGVDEKTLLDVLESGECKYKDDCRLWVFKEILGREDNLVCAAIVLEEYLIVKTVMIRWELA